MAVAKQFLKFTGSTEFPDAEKGPFDSASFNGSVFLNGSSSSCAEFADGLWTITDGAALGDEHMTGNTYSVILGQAKLVE